MYTTHNTVTGNQIHAVGYAGKFEDPANPSRKAFCGAKAFGKLTGNNPYVTCQKCKKSMFGMQRRWTHIGSTVETKVRIVQTANFPGFLYHIDRIESLVRDNA